MVSNSEAADDQVVSGRMLRPIGWSTLLLTARAPYVLYIVAGLSGLPLLLSGSARDLMRAPGLAVALAVASVGFGLVVFVFVELRPDLLRRRPEPFVVTTLVVAGAAVTVGVFAYGPSFGVITLAYPQAAIFAFMLLRTAWATASVVLIGVEYASVVSVQAGWVAPLGHWTALMAGTVGISVVAGQLTARIIQLADSEQRALTELGQVNATLQERVDEQVAQLERAGQLRRFLAPQVADAVLSGDEEHLLSPHRRRVAVFFCDLRGFTNFAAQVEPEDVIDVLDAYYRVVGERLRESNATIGSFAGDGIMAYLNDPVPCDDPAGTATAMATAIRTDLDKEVAIWRSHGYELSYGIGIAVGHATLGVVGFEGRQDYTALGTVVNLAARLCAAAQPGQVLIDRRAASDLDDAVATEAVADLALKGFPAEMEVFAVS